MPFEVLSTVVPVISGISGVGRGKVPGCRGRRIGYQLPDVARESEVGRISKSHERQKRCLGEF